MLQLPKPNTFADYGGQPALTTRPNNTYGIAVTPGNNAYGAYGAGGVLSTSTGYGLWVLISGVGVSTLAKDCVVTIGLDGVDWIVDLLASCASLVGSQFGAAYYFPILVPAGASLSAKASVNNATVGTVRVALTTALQPSRSPNAWYGTYVRTFGSTPASSSGTVITPGQAAEGAWTALGAAVAAGDALRYFECGFGINNATMAAMVYGLDVGIGAGGVAKLASVNTWAITTAAEQAGKQPTTGGWCDAFPGDIVYGRMQCSGVPDSGISMAAYGVG